MDTSVKNRLKRSIFLKVWERCKSWNAGSKTKTARIACNSLTKSRSWHCPTTRSSSSEEENIEKGKKKPRVAPAGCFPVYVGEEKQRFVIRTEIANHPLFKILLEDAELEYGFNSEGPLLLPCDVDLFYKVLAEMDSGEEISTTPRSWRTCLLILCGPQTWFSVNYNRHMI
ncbi:auxin-responsive protein SAUR72 [Ricinus communis]|uniref:Calmodulin binding protein, putative n=1 Tax=Ricinus communis TaxID=3988 RepID=B9RAA8_RICCO|nr:auxin-responsive protein SAUR72 [Ricinus communis]EEF51735.1 calmodulin binding protein, putative [Ricinus communis]|eukprot:XP_002511133.1 auxin-responsive protein SAUR72 [Ricinus communis]